MLLPFAPGVVTFIAPLISLDHQHLVIGADPARGRCTRWAIPMSLCICGPVVEGRIAVQISTALYERCSAADLADVTPGGRA